jgi:hypothetical protein
MYWRRRLSRLEAAIYGTAVALVLLVFLERLLFYMELSERTVMEVTVSNVNSALHVRRAYDLLARKAAANDETALSHNPFELAGMSPANFLGEAVLPNLVGLERGNWIFDRSRRELIYLPRLSRSLQTADPDGAIRFRLEPRSNSGLMLAPTSKYKWGVGA